MIHFWNTLTLRKVQLPTDVSRLNCVFERNGDMIPRAQLFGLVVNGATRNTHCATFPHFKCIAYNYRYTLRAYLEVRASLFTFGI